MKFMNITAIDPWFLHNIRQIIEKEEELKKVNVATEPEENLKDIIREAKQYGFSR